MENIKKIVRLLAAAFAAMIMSVGALAEEASDGMNMAQRFLETGKITVLGMCGIFVVMIIVFLVITILNKTTK